MNESYIRKLIRLVEESEIECLEVSGWWGRKVKITAKGHTNGNGSNGNGHGAVMTAAPITVAAPIPVHQPQAAPAPAAQTQPVASEENSHYLPIKSPMVGTFYAAPAPDAQPYVSMNQKITVGQVVCIVEAMKLMNEIESEVAGRVVKILAENGKPVEFGQTLFLIEPE